MPIAAAAGLDQLEQVNRNAAEIDLGATVHFVAVPPGRDPETHVRCFETFTADLQALADWLEQCGIGGQGALQIIWEIGIPEDLMASLLG